MRTKFLLLVPVLVLIAGCSEPIGAQENDTASSEIETMPEPEQRATEDSEEQASDVELRSPVGID